jgi:UDP-2-acetamido-2-deoxy-ribo-hexuluronate aminotransferase
MKFIDLDTQYNLVKNDLNKRLKKQFIRKDFILGKEVKELENNLSKISKFKYVETCANGTDALSLSLKALLKNRKEKYIIVPNFSYFASAEVIPLNGHIPVFVDIQKDFTISFNEILKAYRYLRKSKLSISAIIGVDLFGYECDHQKIYSFCKKKNIKYIIDGAQSFTSFYHENTKARYCDVWCTSFFPAKSLGCYGDGGAVFTQNSKIAKYINSLKKHGVTNPKKKMLHQIIGVNSRLDTIQAAVLNSKLKILSNEVKKKRQIYNKIKLKIENLGYFIPNSKHDVIPTVLTVVCKNTRHRKILEMKYKPNVIYYQKILSDQVAFKKVKKLVISFKNAKDYTKKVISLPFHPYLSLKEYVE